MFLTHIGVPTAAENHVKPEINVIGQLTTLAMCFTLITGKITRIFENSYNKTLHRYKNLTVADHLSTSI